ncbi:MAG: flagellin [Betaproteobacteria bacterium]
MASIINTNIASLNAQRNLAMSQTSLATSMQRLSSGLRINSAKDDAAGLAITERFTTQIRGLNQAARNANDGISLSQTAEGALGEMTSNLQRIRELAVQSANSTNSASDRAALDQEVQQRLSEIDRVATQTAFNGLKLLDGSFGNSTFQVGANVGDTISISLATSMRITAIGRTADYVDSTTPLDTTKNIGAQGAGVTTGVGAALTGALTLAVGPGQAVAVGGSVAGPAGANAGQTDSSAYAKATAINAAGINGLSTQADTTTTFAFNNAVALGYALSINNVPVQAATTTTPLTGTQLVVAINANSAGTGVTATYDGSAGTMTLNAADGRDIILSQTAAAGQGLGAATGSNNTKNALLTLAGGTAAATAVGTLRLFSSDSITIAGLDAAKIGYVATTLALGNSALNTVGVTTVTNSNTAITRVDAALTSVSGLRSTFGAIQNRFESVIANLSTTSENLTASRSRIQDADFAQETANLSRAQILQQAGTAMVAQANQLPQGVLALLRQ